MTKFSKCQSDGCDHLPAFRFTWPGRSESAACVVCALKLRSIAAAMGCPLQLIQLSVDGLDLSEATDMEPQP